MAEPSSQLNFLKQIQNAKSETQIHFRSFLSSIDDLQKSIIQQLEDLEEEYHREFANEEKLRHLTKQMSQGENGKQNENRWASISDEIDQLVSEKNSKLLVLDWNCSGQQQLLETFCKLSIKTFPSCPLQENDNTSFIDSTEKLNLEENTRPKPHNTIPYSGSLIKARTTSRSLEQRYKETRNPIFTCSTKRSNLQGVAVHDTTGEIYVADFQKDCISVFNKEASYIRNITHNRMVSPVGIYVSDEYDRLFMTVSGRAAVQCYKLDGTFTKEILCYNRSGLGFDNPAGITMDYEGRIYVCDQGNSLVPVFTRFLVFITVLTTQVSDPSDVKVVGSEVAILHSGEEYCVSFFTRGGQFLRSVATGYS